MNQNYTIAVDRLIVTAMMTSFLISLTFDTSTLVSTNYIELQRRAPFDIRPPQKLFITLIFASTILLVAGAIGRIAKWRKSRALLALGALLTVASYPSYFVYLYSSISGMAEFVFAVSLGWLLAKPIPRD